MVYQSTLRMKDIEFLIFLFRMDKVVQTIILFFCDNLIQLHQPNRHVISEETLVVA